MFIVADLVSLIERQNIFYLVDKQRENNIVITI